jgi:hypothetical protein
VARERHLKAALMVSVAGMVKVVPVELPAATTAPLSVWSSKS